MSKALLCVCGHSIEDAMDRVDDAAELQAVAESWGSALNDVVSMEEAERQHTYPTEDAPDDVASMSYPIEDAPVPMLQASRQPPYPIEDAPNDKPLTKLQAFLADMEAHGA